VATEQHQMRSEQRICFVLGSPRLPCGRRAKNSFEESGRSIWREKDECQVRLILYSVKDILKISSEEAYDVSVASKISRTISSGQRFRLKRELLCLRYNAIWPVRHSPLVTKSWIAVRYWAYSVCSEAGVPASGDSGWCISRILLELATMAL